MKEQRRLGKCEECGDDDVAMATTTACFKCYQRARRANGREPDLHNPSLRKEHVKLVKHYSKLMEVFAALRVNDATKDAVMLYIRPYFRTIEHLVNLDVGTTNQSTRPSAPNENAANDDDEQRARMMRIFSAPVLNRVISDEDFTTLTPKSRAQFERELMENLARHRAAMTIPPDCSIEEWFRKTEAQPSAMHALAREGLEIAARYGVPRAIAALKGEMSSKMKKAMKVAKAMLKQERDEARKRGEIED
jgi:hypothetical protein